jgi:Domain of unknown function (DUF4351)/Transposase
MAACIASKRMASVERSLDAARKRACATPDPRDADLLLDILTQHRKRLRPLKPDTVETRTLQLLTETRRALVDEKTSQSNCLTGTLKLYFPQMVQWFDRVDSALVGALLERWPTLEQLRLQDAGTLRQFFREHDQSGERRLENRLEQIRLAMPATLDPAVIQSAALQTGILVRLIQVLREGIAKMDKEIDRISKAHPDYPVMDSFPGAGQALVPRMIAGVGTQREQDIRQHNVLGPEFKRAMQEGVQQGLQQGVQQEASTLLRRLIEKRFGAVPGWAEERIANRSVEELEELSVRVLDAHSVEELLT